MIRCENCHLELPADAQFCSNCGQKLGDSYSTVTYISNPIELDQAVRQTPPPLSSQPNTDPQESGMGQQDTFATHQTYWSFDERELSHTLDAHQTDEHGFVIPDLLLPGMLAMQNPISSPSQPPMVQGTPQFGGVPSVQGTPVVPGNVAQPAAGALHGPALSAPSSAPQEAEAHPMYHRQVQQSHYQSTTHPQQPPHHQQPAPHQSPVHHQQPVPSGAGFEHKHHHSGPLHKHHKHVSKLHHSATATSKAGMSTATKWLIIAIVSLLVIGSGGVLLAHAFMPTTTPTALSITGSNVVRGGDVMHIHGQGFQPGDAITLTIDNGLPVSFLGQHSTQALAQRSESNAQVVGLAQMNIAGALHPRTPDNVSVTVNSSGTFDANVTVPTGLHTGQHVLHARDNQSSRSASLQFTVTSSQLVVNPTALNFGSVEVGRTVKLLVTVNNLGGASLHWTATVEGSQTNWLTLSKNSDVLGTNGANETVVVTANTNGLAVGSRYATLHFHSDNGDVLIIANIHVVSVGQTGQRAILNVSQQSLDFGQLQEGQSAQKSVSIANLGNIPLQWQASVDAASAHWLSLSATKGTVQQGAVPQTVQFNADTSGLAAGSYSGTVNITSNGGNAQVKVTLRVKNTPRIPTVTGINPTSGPAAGGTSVTISGTGFSGATSVSFGTTPASTFTVVSDTQVTVTSPAGSGTVDVTVTTPVGTSVTSSADQFTYMASLPKVTGISPTSGPGTGGTSVTITGTGLSNATGVSFGSTNASTYTVVSDTKITATSPVGSGTVDVTVTTPVGTSVASSIDQFTYNAIPPPTPKVTSISPTSGQDTGGTSVTISGTGFTGATGVSFGSTNASTYTVVSDTKITATSPAGSGTVDVTVTTPSGTSATSSADQFTYNAALPPTPTVSGVSPSSGSSTGGTAVTITGTGFTGATSVLFGKTQASNVSVVSDTQITAKSPAGSGTVDVTVTAPGGTSSVNSSDRFTYTSVAPSWSVNPTSLDGSTCGQTAPCRVTLTEDVNSTGSISWSASSKIGATFKPPSGTLSPIAQQNSVTISILAPCQNDTFTFTGSGGVKPLTVTWSCTPTPTPTPTTQAQSPTLTVNPTSLSDLSGSPCSSDATSGLWSCTVTVMEDSNSQGNLTWSVQSSLSGVTYSSSGSTLTPGQSVSVTISNIPCVSSGTFTFSGGANPVVVTWTCGS